MIKAGDLVEISEAASIYTTGDYKESTFGIVVSINSARHEYNLDSDGSLCEVISDKDTICLAWEDDLLKICDDKNLQ